MQNWVNRVNILPENVSVKDEEGVNGLEGLLKV